jgi:hypothetical protein
MEAVMFGQDDKPRTLPYHGPGVWVTVASHFGPRLSEWAGSASMLLLGVVYLFIFGLFDDPEYIYFKAVFGTQTLPGVVLFLFGFLGLIGLTVNGMRKEVTPWIRYSRAMVGFLLFTGMSTCFALSGVFSVWLAWYPVAAAVELVNMFRTSKDAGESYGSP